MARRAHLCMPKSVRRWRNGRTNQIPHPRTNVPHSLFHIVPDPEEAIEEVITDEVLAKSESVDYEEGQQLKAEFRSIIESLDEYPEVRRTVLAALDDMDANSNQTGGDNEWLTVQSVMGRRIRILYHYSPRAAAVDSNRFLNAVYRCPVSTRCTAMPSAFFVPTSTTSLLPLVTAV